VQVAAFRDRENAEGLRKSLLKDGFRADVERRGGFHKVVVGPFPDKDAANRTIRKLKAERKVDPILVRR